MKLIRDAVTEQWGERCPDFDPDCYCCLAWREIDELEALQDWVARFEKESAVLMDEIKRANERFNDMWRVAK